MKGDFGVTYDYIVIGAGIAGITAAQRIATVLRKRVLVIEKRDHVGGNCYDYYDEKGILIHKYGPHVLHTKNRDIYQYLSLFTNWNVYNHKILGKIEDELLPIPFNLISIHKAFLEKTSQMKKALLDNYNVDSKVDVNELKNSANEYLREIGEYVDEKFLSTYCEKQWGVTADNLDSSFEDYLKVIPSYNCRYYDDKYQGMPSKGYTDMFLHMLNNPDINIILNKDYREILSVNHQENKIYYKGEEFKGKIIFTAMIDEFFEYKYGILPYHSLIHINECVDYSNFQGEAVICYPEEYHFTRIIEYKYLTGQSSNHTSIQFEYPSKYNPNVEEQSIPYYPIHNEDNLKLYEKYRKLTENYPNVKFIGRLAEYKYMEMDEVVEKVLKFISEEKVSI